MTNYFDLAFNKIRLTGITILIIGAFFDAQSSEILIDNCKPAYESIIPFDIIIDSLDYNSLRTIGEKIALSYQDRLMPPNWNGDIEETIMCNEAKLNKMRELTGQYISRKSKLNSELMDYLLQQVYCYADDSNVARTNLCEKNTLKSLKSRKGKSLLLRVNVENNGSNNWNDEFGGNVYVSYSADVIENVDGSGRKQNKQKSSAYSLKINVSVSVTAVPSGNRYSLKYSVLWPFKSESEAAHFQFKNYDELNCDVKSINETSNTINCNSIGS